MCGIAGFVNPDVSGSTELILNRMLTRIQHRGPDECGLYLNKQACMGNVRLSIVDLASGQQPLSTEDRTMWIAYNGEVYNHLELKEELVRKGHRFRTNCDTEVVLHLYQEYGAECLPLLNGQFAFSIWDERKKELFLARDRMGIRPLFYTFKNRTIVFGSEVKSIFEYPGIERQLSYKSLKEVFSFWTTLTPNSAFKNIYEIPPGHFGVLKDGKFDLKRYWSLSFSKKSESSGDLEESIEEFRSLFEDSISLRMRADVPVAAYLSGGLDSSSTTAFIKKLFPQALNTFSIGFEDKDFDETRYQKEVADYFDTNHRSVSFQNDDVTDLFEKVIWHTEIPILRSAPFPMYRLSKLVRDSGIKVVVTGEGADEALGGYNIFKEVLIRHFWARIPHSKIRPLLLKKLYPYIPQLQNANASLLRLFFGYQLENTQSPIYSHLLRWNNSGKIMNHFSQEVKDSLNGYDPIASYAESIIGEINDYSPLAKAQFIESNVFLSGYLLSSQGDRVAMANSVEGRYPFLDHRMLEFCARLPDKFKLNGMDEKYLLKRLMKGKIPESVVKRPKQAYRAPIASALMADKNGFVESILDHSQLKEATFFNPKSVQLLLKRLKNSNQVSEVDNMALMGLLSTQVVHNKFVRDFKHLTQSELRRGVVMNEKQVKINN